MSASGLINSLDHETNITEKYNHTVLALCKARINNLKIRPESHIIPTLHDAYAIQKHLLHVYTKITGTKVSGWKVALSGQGAQQKYQIKNPVYGFLTHSAEFYHQASIQAHDEDELKLEVELVFSFKHDLIAGRVYSDTELISAIDEIRPALEVANVRWKHWNIDLMQFIADNSAAGIYVIGDPIQLDIQQLINNPHVTVQALFEESNTVFSVTTNEVDHPIANYLWVVRQLLSNGQHISAGKIVLTGSLIRPIAIDNGQYVFNVSGQQLKITVA